MGELDLAETCYLEAMKQDPYVPCVCLAALYMRSGRSEKAAEFFPVGSEKIEEAELQLLYIKRTGREPGVVASILGSLVSCTVSRPRSSTERPRQLGFQYRRATVRRRMARRSSMLRRWRVAASWGRMVMPRNAGRSHPETGASAKPRVLLPSTRVVEAGTYRGRPMRKWRRDTTEGLAEFFLVAHCQAHCLLQELNRR